MVASPHPNTFSNGSYGPYLQGFRLPVAEREKFAIRGKFEFGAEGITAGGSQQAPGFRIPKQRASVGTVGHQKSAAVGEDSIIADFEGTGQDDSFVALRKLTKQRRPGGLFLFLFPFLLAYILLFVSDGRQPFTAR